MSNYQPSLAENILAMDKLPHQIPGFEISPGFIDQNNEKWVKMEDWNRMKAAYLNLMNDHFELEDKFKEKLNEIKDGYLFLVNDNEKLEDSLKQKCDELQKFKVYARKLVEQKKRLNDLNAVLEVKMAKKSADEKNFLEENGRLKIQLEILRKKMAEQNSSGQKCQNLASKSAGFIRKIGRFGIFREEKILGKRIISHQQQPNPQMKFCPAVEQKRKNFGWNWVKPKKENYPKRVQTFIHHPAKKGHHFETKNVSNNNENLYQKNINYDWIRPKNHRQNAHQRNIRNAANYDRLRTIEHFEGRNGLKNFGMERNGNGFFGSKNVGLKANWKKKRRFRNGIDPEVEKWFEKRMANWEKRKEIDSELRISLGLNSYYEESIVIDEKEILMENCVSGGKMNDKGLETDRSDRPMSNAKGANDSADCENDLGCSGSEAGTNESSRMEGKNEENLEEDDLVLDKFFGYEFGGRSAADLCDRPVSNANFPGLLTMIDGVFDSSDHRNLSETG